VGLCEFIFLAVRTNRTLCGDFRVVETELQCNHLQGWLEANRSRWLDWLPGDTAGMEPT